MREKIAEYIPFLEECFEGKPYTLAEVSGGRSYDIKVKVSCEGSDYILKVIEGNLEKDESNRARVAWYQALAMMRSKDPCVLGPVRYGFINCHVVTLTEWISGEQLNSVFSEKPELMKEYGERLGRLLYSVHHQEFVTAALAQNGARIAPWVTRTADALREKIRQCGIDFSGMDKAIAYLEENADLISEERACIVHNDVRPENFILTPDNLYIYDFDSGTFNDAFADFTYLTVMSEAKYRPFSYALIKAYFGGGVPLEFWKTNLYFSIMKLLDYAIYKYDKTGKMIVNQANNFIEVFDNYENPVPHWWTQMEKEEKGQING